jgi:hypothetical protein
MPHRRRRRPASLAVSVLSFVFFGLETVATIDNRDRLSVESSWNLQEKV